MVYLWILAPRFQLMKLIIVRTSQCLYVCGHIQPRPKAVWKGQNERQDVYNSSVLFLWRVLLGHSIHIHMLDLSPGTWQNWDHLIAFLKWTVLSPSEIFKVLSFPKLLQSLCLGQDPLQPSRLSVLCPHYKLGLIFHQKAIHFLSVGTVNIPATLLSFRDFYLFGDTW